MELAPFKALRPLQPTDFLQDRALLALLQRSLDNDPMSMTVEQLIDDIYNGVSLIWSWGEGILITTIESRPAGLVCLVTNVCGEGYLKNLAGIAEDVVSYAKASGCRFILGDVPSPGLVRIYERMGGRTYHRMLREL